MEVRVESHRRDRAQGNAGARVEALVKIANALEVGVDDLLCDSLTTADTPIIENKLAALLSDCSDYEIKMLSEIISNLKSTIRKFNQNKSY